MVDSSQPQSAAPRENLSGSSAAFSLYDIIWNELERMAAGSGDSIFKAYYDPKAIDILKRPLIWR
jgi:hypothetical protein